MHFGGEWEGWDGERAAQEQRFLMETVNRGEWTAAAARPAPTGDHRDADPWRSACLGALRPGWTPSGPSGRSPACPEVGQEVRRRRAHGSDRASPPEPIDRTASNIRPATDNRPSRRATARDSTRTTSARGSSPRSASERAAQLESESRLLIAHMTPRTLRRTFASILAVCDVPPRRAMYLMGHTDPTLTLAIYQQVLDMGKGSVGLLEQTLGCTLPEARAIYNGEATAAEILGGELGTAPGSVSPGRSKGRTPKNGWADPRVSGTNPEPGDENASSGRGGPAIRHEKTPPERGFKKSG